MVRYFTWFLLFTLQSSLIKLTNAAQGGLIVPPPRSYTTTSSRFGLINSHPCGNNAFATQYPSISSVYSGFLHQNIIDKSSQIITEGSVLNITWIPVFYSTNSSYYRFSLCMDTSTYTYTKCIILSEIGTNRTQFNLLFDNYDINQYNSGFKYHWSSITDKMSIYEEQTKQHSLQIPNHLFHSLGITDTTSKGQNLSSTLIFEWVVSDYQVIDNCADLILLPDNDENEDHSNYVTFDDLVTPTIKSLPGMSSDSDSSGSDGSSVSTNDVCTTNPNGTAYQHLSQASIGTKCGKNEATCAPGQCCNKYGVCGPYMSNVYEYYYNDILLESIPIYFSIANSGPIDPLSAQLSFCETDILIDNRYIPDYNKLTNLGYDTPNDFLDLCWMCTLDDPKQCTYDNWFDTNGTTPVLTQSYKFYDSATESTDTNNNNGDGNSGSGGNNGGGNNSNDSRIGDLVVIIIFLAIFCCIFAWLYRVYKYSKTKSRTTKMRLLDLEPDDMGKGRDPSNSAIDAAGGSMHAQDDITYGQHGYSDGSDIDENENDPLDNNNDVGGILGRSSLDAQIANEKPLPHGWEEYRTDAGEKYYHNPETNVTQWDRPQ